MANLKNITDLPMAASAEGLNLIVNDNGAAKQIAAHEVGAQADWNITDEKNPGFIKNKPEVVKSVNGVKPAADGEVQVETSWENLKNKPFYAEMETFTVLENQTIIAGTPTMFNVTKQFNVGDIAEVIYNGNRYATVVKGIQGAVYIGNVSLLGSGDDSGEPFFIAPAGPDMLGMVCVDDATVSLYVRSEIVHKLDAKYLPDGVGSGYDAVIVELGPKGSNNWQFHKGSYFELRSKIESGNVPNIAIVSCLQGADNAVDVIRAKQVGFWRVIGYEVADDCLHLEVLYRDPNVYIYLTIEEDGHMNMWEAD